MTLAYTHPLIPRMFVMKPSFVSEPEIQKWTTCREWTAGVSTRPRLHTLYVSATEPEGIVATTVVLLIAECWIGHKPLTLLSKLRCWVSQTFISLAG